jgi:hypothetical protein
MKQKSIRLAEVQTTEANINMFKRALPKKAIVVEFEENPYFKEFLAYFFTAQNLSHVQNLVDKLADLHIENEQSEGEVAFYEDPNFYTYLQKKLLDKQNELTDLFFQKISKEELLRMAAAAGAF